MEHVNENYKDKVYQVIERIEQRKRLGHIVPTFALHSEVHTALGIEPNQYLTALYHEGRIGYRRTLNQLSYHIKQKES